MRHILATVLVGAVLSLAATGALAASPRVDGEVTQVSTYSVTHGTPEIAIDGTPYAVPLAFYLQVHVGNIVQSDGSNWTIAQ
jgi:hypothetical protein